MDSMDIDHQQQLPQEQPFGNGGGSARGDSVNGTGRQLEETSLFIGRLALDTTKHDLERLFSRHGRIRRCEVKRGGYAFVDFFERSDAEHALVENGSEFMGERIAVQFAKARKAEPGSNACFRCGDPNHWSRDCPMRDEDRGMGFARRPPPLSYRSGPARRRSRSRSRSPYRRSSRRYSRSRSRSRSPYRRSSRRHSRSRSRSRSRSSYRRSSRRHHSRSRSRSRTPPRRHASRSRSRSRSRSPVSSSRRGRDRESSRRHASRSRSRSRTPPRDRDRRDRDRDEPRGRSYSRTPSPSRD
ncbi:hypothetical protein AMAG_12354 [Allomyces macrogynus ATCC 38327]|uniref:RRM domain-containing protein n=1 Tax=Allomyces macrogynus (strain ATCC 38327) TaxID=578462 RepID=A0A0L0SY72_ALLM3|nr:hypothetical protein AMAG_12354 [Allomyces macrogynus ATCC 38327]|eukprot:KNE67289.1 hypothetical protein AMAG_12354 [Allomyces macrogynus ATCC 38327]